MTAALVSGRTRHRAAISADSDLTSRSPSAEDAGGALGAEADEQDGGLLAAAQASKRRRGVGRPAAGRRCAHGRAWPRSFRILADPGAQLLGDALRLLLHEVVDRRAPARAEPAPTAARAGPRSWTARARPAGGGPRSRSATGIGRASVSRRRRARVMKKRKRMLARPMPAYFSG
jgi:hypothetical protein